MTYTTWKVVHTPFRNNAWVSNEATTLTSFYDPKVKVALGDNRDTFEFKVSNVFSSFDGTFNNNDKITLSRVINSTTVSSSDLIMVGTLKDVPTSQTAGQDELRLEGYNYTETVLGAITFFDGSTKTIPQGLTAALGFVSLANPNFAVTWDSGNPSTTTTGAAFPVMGEPYYYKPLRQIFEKYSTKNATGDQVNYYYYVNTSNKLVWLPRTSTVSSSFDTAVDPYKEFKTSKDTKDVKNFVIIKGGTDPAGKPIQTFYQDAGSTAKHGFKFQFLVGKNVVAKELLDQDMLSSWGADYKTQNVSYPNLATSFTTTWVSSVTTTVEGVTMNAGSTVTINLGSEADNKDAYTAVMREHVKGVLKKEAQQYVDGVKYGKLKADLELQVGQVNWVLGDNIELTAPVLASTPKKMRVTEIQYGTSTDLYSLEEDEGSL